MQQKKKKNKKVIILCSILAVVVLSAIAYMIFKPDEKLAVSTVEVTKQTINETLDTTGTVSTASEKTYALIDKVKVKTVNVKVGDTVKAGDVLATFDVSSLEAALNEKENNYQKALAAYNKAKNEASSASKSIASTKKQISDLEKQIETLKAKSNTSKNKPSSSGNSAGVKVSDDLVKRFIKVAKLFGVEYDEATAKKVLTALLSAGSSSSDISGLLDNLGKIAGGSGSFDMNAFAKMSGGTVSGEYVTPVTLCVDEQALLHYHVEYRKQ